MTSVPGVNDDLANLQSQGPDQRAVSRGRWTGFAGIELRSACRRTAFPFRSAFLARGGTCHRVARRAFRWTRGWRQLRPQVFDGMGSARAASVDVVVVGLNDFFDGVFANSDRGNCRLCVCGVGWL